MSWLSWIVGLAALLLIPSVVIAFVIRALALDSLLVIVVFGYTIWFLAWARGVQTTDQEIWRGEARSLAEIGERIERSYAITRSLDPARILLVLSWMTFLALGFLQNLS